MTVSASIKFTQGGTTDVPGRAVIGAVASPVVCSNGDNTNVQSYTWTLKDVPAGSAVTPGVLAQGPAASTATFTPDVAGCYRMQLDVVDAAGNIITDLRVFGVRNSRGWLVPSFHSGATELNFAGATRGWAPLMETILADLKTVADAGGGGGGGAARASGDVVGQSASPQVRYFQGYGMRGDFAPTMGQALAFTVGAFPVSILYSAGIVYMLNQATSALLWKSLSVNSRGGIGLPDLPIDTAQDMCFGAANTIWVASTGGNTTAPVATSVTKVDISADATDDVLGIIAIKGVTAKYPITALPNGVQGVAIAYDPIRGNVWLANTANANLYRVNGTTGVVTAFAIPAACWSIVYFNGFLYAGQNGGGTIYKVDPTLAPGSAVVSIASGAAGFPGGFSVDTTDNLLFAAQDLGTNAVVIRITPGDVVTPISTGADPVWATCWNSVGDELFVLTGATSANKTSRRIVTLAGAMALGTAHAWGSLLSNMSGYGGNKWMTYDAPNVGHFVIDGTRDAALYIQDNGFGPQTYVFGGLLTTLPLPTNALISTNVVHNNAAQTHTFGAAETQVTFATPPTIVGGPTSTEIVTVTAHMRVSQSAVAGNVQMHIYIDGTIGIAVADVSLAANEKALISCSGRILGSTLSAGTHTIGIGFLETVAGVASLAGGFDADLTVIKTTV